MNNSTYGSYEQILAEFLGGFVDKSENGSPLVYRNNPPSIDKVRKWGEPKVYAVYTVFEGDFGQQTVQPVSLYAYESQGAVFAKKEALRKAIQNDSVIVSGEDIKVKFTSGNPFVQDKPDADPNVKGYYINILATVYKA